METNYLECACSSAEHAVRFTYVKDDFSTIYVETHLTHRGFFTRLWRGLRYIFGYRCIYGEWDETVLEREQVIKLKELCDKFLINYKEE